MPSRRAASPAKRVSIALVFHRWGLAGSILALETLKLAMAPINRARDMLVGQALQAGLVPLLLAKLDWRKAGSGSNQGEEEVQREQLASVLCSAAERTRCLTACLGPEDNTFCHDLRMSRLRAWSGY